MTRRPRSPRPRVLVALAIAVFLLAPSPRAEAISKAPDWSQVTFRVTWSACPGSNGDYNPQGQIRMQEFGQSRVIAFTARYQLRAAEGGIASSLAQYDATYSTDRFPDDYRNYWVKLPSDTYHQWRDVILQPRLEVKATWDRVWWKPDWKTQRIVAVCQG